MFVNGRDFDYIWGLVACDIIDDEVTQHVREGTKKFGEGRKTLFIHFGEETVPNATNSKEKNNCACFDVLRLTQKKITDIQKK